MASQLRQYSLSCNKNPNLHSFDFFLFFLSGFTSVAEVATVLAKVFMCASILMLVALTWERHFAICSPHQYRIHIRTTPRWRHLCRYFIPVMLCSILFNIPTFINIEVCTGLCCTFCSQMVHYPDKKWSIEKSLTYKNNAFPSKLATKLKYVLRS